VRARDKKNSITKKDFKIKVIYGSFIYLYISLDDKTKVWN